MVQLREVIGLPDNTVQLKLVPPCGSNTIESLRQIVVSISDAIIGLIKIGIENVCATDIPGGLHVESFTVTVNTFNPISVFEGDQLKQPFMESFL